MNRESINLSYFDKNKELSIDLHYEMYRNIKNDIYAIASHYPINFVIAETEVIKKSNETLENLIKYIEDKIEECNNHIKMFRKTDYKSIFIGTEIAHLNDFKRTYQDLLERIKNNNYD